MLRSLAVIISNDIEDFSNHSETVDLLNVFDLTAKILIGKRCYGLNFSGRIAIIINSTTISKSIVHRQLLLEVTNLFLEPFDP